MTEIKTIQGVTDVYDSKEAKGFEQSAEYPIAWEFVFVNDKSGKQFVNQLLESLDKLPKENGYLLDLIGEVTDVARCAECIFASKDAFRKVLNESLNNMAIYDEKQQGIKPKQQLLDQVNEIISKELVVT